MGRKSRRDIVRENLDICVASMLRDPFKCHQTFYIKHDDLWVDICVLHRDKETHKPIRITLELLEKSDRNVSKDFLNGITVGCCVGRKTLVDIYTEYVLKRIQVINKERKEREKMRDVG